MSSWVGVGVLGVGVRVDVGDRECVCVCVCTRLCVGSWVWVGGCFESFRLLGYYAV